MYAQQITKQKRFSHKKMMADYAFKNQAKIADLLTDKKSLWIEEAELIGQNFHVSYCPEWTLNNANPDWSDVKIKRGDLVKFIIEQGFNKFTSFEWLNGDVIPNEVEQEAETFLLEADPLECNKIIKEYLEMGGQTNG